MKTCWSLLIRPTMRRALEALKAGSVTPALRRELAMKVFQHTARYDSLIAGYLEKQVQGSETKFPADSLPPI